MRSLAYLLLALACLVTAGEAIFSQTRFSIHYRSGSCHAENIDECRAGSKDIVLSRLCNDTSRDCLPPLMKIFLPQCSAGDWDACDENTNRQDRVLSCKCKTCRMASDETSNAPQCRRNKIEFRIAKNCDDPNDCIPKVAKIFNCTADAGFQSCSNGTMQRSVVCPCTNCRHLYTPCVFGNQRRLVISRPCKNATDEPQEECMQYVPKRIEADKCEAAGEWECQGERERRFYTCPCESNFFRFSVLSNRGLAPETNPDAQFIPEGFAAENSDENQIDEKESFEDSLKPKPRRKRSIMMSSEWNKMEF